MMITHLKLSEYGQYNEILTNCQKYMTNSYKLPMISNWISAQIN